MSTTSTPARSPRIQWLIDTRWKLMDEHEVVEAARSARSPKVVRCNPADRGKRDHAGR
jgi:hypothetical protein